jgi:hypothetical protein
MLMLNNIQRTKRVPSAQQTKGRSFHSSPVVGNAVS